MALASVQERVTRLSSLVLIGLPALRLRGLYFALITLMLSGAITVVLATVNFPNGGGSDPVPACGRHGVRTDALGFGVLDVAGALARATSGR